jgi:hypothetical protein
MVRDTEMPTLVVFTILFPLVDNKLFYKFYGIPLAYTGCSHCLQRCHMLDLPCGFCIFNRLMRLYCWPSCGRGSSAPLEEILGHQICKVKDRTQTRALLI